MALFDLYKYISETEIKEAQAPLITIIEVPDVEQVVTQETITEEVDGEQVERVVDVVTENVVNRQVEVIISNPKEQDFIKAGYKTLTIGREVQEVPIGYGIKVTYEDKNPIVKNEDLFQKQVIDEPKPEVAPENPYYMWGAYSYETETQVINSWREVEKPIEGEEPTYNHDTQYITFEDEIKEDKVIRTYTINAKAEITDPDPSLPADYEENAQWYSLQDYIDYSHPTEIHKGKKYVLDTERRHIDLLTITRREFILMLEEVGLNYYEQLLPAINSTHAGKLEWELASCLLRMNPLIDQISAGFGITPEQIDLIFLVANGEATIEQLRATK